LSILIITAQAPSTAFKSYNAVLSILGLSTVQDSTTETPSTSVLCSKVALLLFSFSKYMADEEIANDEAVLNAKKVIAQANFDLVNKGVNLLAGLAGKNKALQKAAIIAQAGIGIFSVIKDTQAANAAAIAPPPIGIGPLLGPGLQIRNTIGGALSIASITAASAKALSAVGSGGSVGGGSIGSVGGGGSAPAAPSFNVVGASSTNQLAQTIGNQQQQPIKTYVVAGDISTAQSLERNIISSASIG